MKPQHPISLLRHTKSLTDHIMVPSIGGAVPVENLPEWANHPDELIIQYIVTIRGSTFDFDNIYPPQFKKVQMMYKRVTILNRATQEHIKVWLRIK